MWAALLFSLSLKQTIIKIFLLAIAIFIAVTQFKRFWADQLWSLISLIVYYLLIIVVVQALEWYRLAQRPHPVSVEFKTKDGRQNHVNLHPSSNQLDNKVNLFSTS